MDEGAATSKPLRLLCTDFILVAALFCATVAVAAPRALEEQAQVELPGPSDQIVSDLAIDGDQMIVAATRIDEDEMGLVWSYASAHVFQRTPQNEWQYVTTLATEQAEWQDAASLRVALHGNVAAVDANELRIFEYDPSHGWTQVATFPSPNEHYLYGGTVKVDSGTVVVGGPDCAWQAYRKDASSQWVQSGQATDPTADLYCFATLDVSDSLIVSGPSNWITTPPSEVRIYADFAATPTATLASPFGHDPYFGVEAVIDGDTIATVASRRPGLQIFRRDDGGDWQFVGTASSADALVNEQGYNLSIIDLDDQFAVGAYPFDKQRGTYAGSVPVFRKRADGSFTEVARLLASDARPGMVLGTHVAIGGRRVAASVGYDRDGAVYVFELPDEFTQPDNVQDDFEENHLARWTPLPGSVLSIESTPRSHVLRQSSRAADAGAYVTDMDWTDQAIQADVRVTRIDGKDRWFGLVVRRSDPKNYYYVTVRSSNSIELRRMVNGRFEVMESASFPFELNRDYRLRLEAVGSWMRAYVDGQLLVEARDATHTHGQAGIHMYRASAEYDNVVITPNPQLLIAEEQFDRGVDLRWTVIDGDWRPRRDEAVSRSSYRQSAASGIARAVSGVSTEAQIIQVSARAEAFSGESAWFGLMGRYVDSSNYYYAALGANGTISLGKLEGGSATVLATASIDVSPSVWYRLRLEIIDDALRVYVDDRFVLQARDAAFASGRYGLASFATVAEYAGLLGWQP